MKLTVKQMKSLEFRKGRLLEKVEALDRLLSGRDVSLLPLVRTETGRYSEKRTWALVEELLAALEKYRQYLRHDDQDDETELAPYRLPEQERSLYRSFLYCAIRMAAGNPWWIRGSYWPKGTFGDILALAKQTGYERKVDLYFDELYARGGMWGFFAYMDDFYEALTGQKISTTITEEEQLEAREWHQKEVQEWEESEDEMFSPEELEKIYMEEYESLSDGEKQALDEEAEQNRKDAQEKQAWVRAFPQKESFCQQYLLFRKLYFQNWSGLADSIEHMLDIYLYEHGASRLLEDDTYFYAYALFNKLLKQVKDLAEAEDGQ